MAGEEQLHRDPTGKRDDFINSSILSSLLLVGNAVIVMREREREGGREGERGREMGGIGKERRRSFPIRKTIPFHQFL